MEKSESSIYSSRSQIEQLSREIIGAAIEVHKFIGPGLLESVYEQCLLEELRSINLQTRQQVQLPLSYKGTPLDTAFKCDLIVENTVILELKTVEAILPVHSAQLLTYLRLTGLPKGYLPNFYSANLSQNFKGMVNKTFFQLPE